MNHNGTNGNGPTAVLDKPTETDAIGAVSIAPLVMPTAQVHITGLSPLVTHAWSEKARKMMLENQQKGKTKGTAKKQREDKDPKADFIASQYRLPDGRYGVPAAAFKGAIVSAGRLIEGVTMTLLKQCVIVLGEGPDQLVPLELEAPPEMWEQPVRIGMGTSDLRYRPRYWPWGATLRVKYVASVLDLGSLVNLVHASGLGGIGEWRPSAPKSMTGAYGMYAVTNDPEAAR